MVRRSTNRQLSPRAPRGVTQTEHHRGVFPRVIPAPTLVRAETSLCLLLHKVPDAADLTPEGSYGQVLTAESACGWMLWQDAGCCSPCALRTAPGPMQGT